MEFDTLVRQLYNEKLQQAIDDFPDCSTHAQKELARSWAEDEIAFQARELMEIWEDTDG